MNDLERQRARDSVNKGELSKQLLENPAYSDAIMKIKATLFDMFTKTSYKDNDDRTEIWRKYQAIESLQNEIEETVDNGKVAIAQLSMFDKAKKLVGVR